MSFKVRTLGPRGAAAGRAGRPAAAAARFALAAAFAGAALAVHAGEAVPAPAPIGEVPQAVSDLSLEYMARQPASMTMCSYGYWAEKAGDHATASRIFDRCIDAGYAGAMIWKALMYEDGSGVAQDSAKAAALLRRAAESGDASYATLGKLHYATALHLGKGVARDEAEALKWFREAAAEGDRDAQEFLRTGHHTADRDRQGRGVGAQAPRVHGQRLEKVAPAPVASAAGWFEAALIAVLAAVFATGLVRQARAMRPRAVSDYPSAGV